MIRFVPMLLAVASLAACSGEEEQLESTPRDPTVEFEILPPDVDTGWPFDTEDTDDTGDTDDTDTSDTDTSDTDDTDTSDTDDTDTSDTDDTDDTDTSDTDA